MHFAYKFAVVTVIVLCAAGLGGCKGESKPGGGEAADAHEHGHEHDHGEQGPHGGHIIELGAETHHAELTHDGASHKVGVYLLGGDAKSAAPIVAESVTINVSVDGQPAQYVLPAVPQTGEEGGKSSYFELDSEPLHTVVSGESESKNATARLSLQIDGKPYVGMIETAAHDHDHDHGHEHEHE
jgi:hypothetical protein